MSTTSSGHRSLANAFGGGERKTPNRAEKLTGLLPTVPRQPRPAPSEVVRTTPVPRSTDAAGAAESPVSDEPAAPTTTVENRTSSTATTVETTVEPREPDTSASADNSGAIGADSVPVTAYLDRQTQAALRKRAADMQCDHAAVVVAAFDTVGSQIPRMFRPGHTTSTSGMPVRAEAFKVKSPVETWFTFTPEQKRWLTDQVPVTGAKNRSRLIAGALALYLGTWPQPS